MIRKIKYKSYSFLLLFILIYLVLFLFLKDRLLFTPDFGESDAYHLNLSLKYFLSENLKQNTLPFWTDKLQGGFPLFSEGQVGALYLPNIIFLKFLPFSIGYNLLLIFALLCLTIGFYLLLTEFKVKPFLALLFSLIFTFNGAISLRWVHLNLIQSFSLTPFLFFFFLKFINTQKKIYLLLFPLILSQMIFAGYLPIVFVALFGFLIWATIFLYYNIKKLSTKVYYFFIALFLILSGVMISLAQLVPTYIMTQQSTRSLGLPYSTVTAFPFSFSELQSFINPFAFGNPRLGSYPPFSDKWGIFWENTPYLGLAFFILLGLVFFLQRKRVFKDKFILGLFGVIFFLILLSLGKNSPLYLIFYFFPFNLFRTQSRYLLMVNFLLIFITALSVNQLYQQTKKLVVKAVLITLLMISTYNVVQFTFNYHLFLDQKEVLKSPEMGRSLNDQIYLTFGQVADWNNVFLTTGWAKKEDQQKYLFFKNYLYPNSNLLLDKRVYDINTGGFRLKRIDYLNGLIRSQITVKDKSYLIDDKLLALLNILGIKNLIVPYEIKNEELKLIKKLNHNKTQINLYTVDDLKDNFYYIPQKLKKIEYVHEFEDEFFNGNLSVNKSVIEDIKDKDLINNSNYIITKTIQNKDDFNLQGNFQDPTLIVFRQNYYPEWGVYIDGKKVKPEKVNLAHIGVSVPKGEHKIELRYENRYFKMGMMVSGAYLIFFIFILTRLKF